MEVRITKYNPDPVDTSLRTKNRFLVIGIVIGRLTTPKVILAVLRG